jgi:hypothetical protein
VKRKLAAIIRRVSASFPDSQKVAEDLQSFARLNEQRLYKLMKTCMDPQTDLKGLVKAMVRGGRLISIGLRLTNILNICAERVFTALGTLLPQYSHLPFTTS